jgi:hypothetical protein
MRAGPYHSTGDSTSRSLVRRRLGLRGAGLPGQHQVQVVQGQLGQQLLELALRGRPAQAGVASTGSSSAWAASLEMPSDKPTARRATLPLAASRTSSG